MIESEEQLVVLCLAGDPAAQAQLHAQFAPAVAAYFLRSGFAQADAEDMTQEVFIRTFRALRTFDAARGQLRSWIGAIARNTARKHWRRRKAAEHFDPELAQEVLPDGHNPGPSLEAREEIDVLKECVASLPKEHGLVIRLRYVEGRTTRGIAAATGLPESTVRLRLAEASQMLETALKAKGFMKD